MPKSIWKKVVFPISFVQAIRIISLNTDATIEETISIIVSSVLENSFELNCYSLDYQDGNQRVELSKKEIFGNCLNCLIEFERNKSEYFIIFLFFFIFLRRNFF